MIYNLTKIDTSDQLSARNWQPRATRALLVALGHLASFGIPDASQQWFGFAFIVLSAALTGRVPQKEVTRGS